MKFAGPRQRNNEVASREAWQVWCESASVMQPELVVFARRWVAMMETRAQRDRHQVRVMARTTMELAGSKAFTPEQIRIAILAICASWYLKKPLRDWAKEQKLIREND